MGHRKETTTAGSVAGCQKAQPVAVFTATGCKVRYNPATMAAERIDLLCRNLMRHRINPNPRGRPKRRGGQADHVAPRWEDRLNVNIDTELLLRRLPHERRVMLLLVHGLQLSLAEAAFVCGYGIKGAALYLSLGEQQAEEILDRQQ